MVKIQIDIPKDQNEQFEMLNKQMALSKAKTIVLLLKEIFKLSQNDFEDLVLGRTGLFVKQNVNIIIDDDIEAYELDWSGASSTTDITNKDITS